MMKQALCSIPVLVLLAACGSEPSEPKSTDDVIAEMSELPKPMPGLYRSTSELIEFDVPGLSPRQADEMRQMSGLRGDVQERCLSPQEAEKGYEDMIRQIGEVQNGLDCDFTKFDAEGKDLDANLSCKGPGGSGAKIAMTGTIEETRSNIDMDMTMSAGPLGEMKLKLETKSERVGDCP